MGELTKPDGSPTGDASFARFLDERSFWYPDYVEGSAWLEHAPFAFWLVGAAAPRSLVELGTHGGYSYFAFCQAVEALGLGTRCHAVDTWLGDDHAGFYGEEIFLRVEAHHDAHYSGFSRLLRETFDEALGRFDDGSIDLLHIDGRHGYEDVRHDFESWRPKLSDRAVVLFHDTCVRDRGVGVWRLWRELCEAHPGFEFRHGKGLGVLGVGRRLPPKVGALLTAGRDEAVAHGLRAAYGRLGAAIQADRDNAMKLRQQEKQAPRHRKLEPRVAKLERELRRVYESRSWRLTAPLRVARSDPRQWIGRLLPGRIRSRFRKPPLDAAALEAREEASRLAEDALRRGELSVAVQHWQRLIDDFPAAATGTIFARLAATHRELGQLALAEAVVARGRARFAVNAPLRIEAAECAMERGQWSEALDLLESVAAEDASRSTIGRRLAGALVQMLEEGRVEEVARRHRATLARVEPRSRLALEGILQLRAGRFEEASKAWQHYWEEARRGAFPTDGNPIPVRSRRLRSPFPTLSRRPIEKYGSLDRPVCVYTALFGDHDVLQAPAWRPDGLDFLCFSDRPREVEGWQVILHDPGEDTPALNNRRLKILPFEALRDYGASLYVDANTLFLGDPLLFVQRWLEDRPFAAWAHPERDDVYTECEAILASCRSEPGPILDLYRRLREESFPAHDGLVEASFLWRIHDDPDVQAFCRAWWDTLQEFPKRDQLCFPHVVHETGIRPGVLPPSLGTSRANEQFVKLPHRHTPIEACQGKDVTVPARADGRGRAISDLVFVFHSEHERVASTVMRGRQLSELARESLDASWSVHYVPEGEVGGIRNAVVVLTKGCCRGLSVEVVEQLKARGNVVCADPVDLAVDPEVADALDLLVSSSLRQHEFLTREGHEVVLITHHVDPAIAGVVAPTDHVAFGYFGEIVNAKHGSELLGHIDLCHIDTKMRSTVWVDRLRHANVHYAVRNWRPENGFKPFLKGFTAAHCGANLLVNRLEGDVVYYLGSDYPYLLEDDSLDGVLDMIEHIRESFGSPEWFEGLEIMKSVRARSSRTHVAREIAAFVRRAVA